MKYTFHEIQNLRENLGLYWWEKYHGTFWGLQSWYFSCTINCQKTDLNKQTHIMISMCKVLLDCKLMASEMKPWKEPVKLNLLWMTFKKRILVNHWSSCPSLILHTLWWIIYVGYKQFMYLLPSYYTFFESVLRFIQLIYFII